jgi:hypothetical protein
MVHERSLLFVPSVRSPRLTGRRLPYATALFLRIRGGIFGAARVGCGVARAGRRGGSDTAGRGRGHRLRGGDALGAPYESGPAVQFHAGSRCPRVAMRRAGATAGTPARPPTTRRWPCMSPSRRWNAAGWTCRTSRRLGAVVRQTLSAPQRAQRSKGAASWIAPHSAQTRSSQQAGSPNSGSAGAEGAVCGWAAVPSGPAASVPPMVRLTSPPPAAGLLSAVPSRVSRRIRDPIRRMWAPTPVRHTRPGCRCGWARAAGLARLIIDDHAPVRTPVHRPTAGTHVPSVNSQAVTLAARV